MQPSPANQRPLTQGEIDQLVLEEYLRRRELRRKAGSFLEFVRHVAPWVILEEVHILIAEHLERVLKGEIDRLMIFIAPRTGKSLLTSTLFPAYYIGHYPDRQIMQVSHNVDLAQGFGRDCRNMLQDEAYAELYPGTVLSKDSRSTASWATTMNGKYSVAGAGTGIAGKGYALGIIDDPLSEQDAHSKAAKDAIWSWYGPGFYTRRMPKTNAIIQISTRWAVDDLAGRLLAQSVADPEADRWTVVSVPAILDAASAGELTRISHEPRYRQYLATEEFPEPIVFKAGGSFSPRRWPLKELLRSKGNTTKKSWAALYQQSPYEDEGGILPRDQWRRWKFDKPPECDFIMQVYDTAFEPQEVNDFSARTTWGIFRRPEDGCYAGILLERLQERLTFPDLRMQAFDAFREYQPDRVIIEKKASGHSLLQELRKKGVPVTAVKVKDSKLARAHAASIVLEQGCVYYMDRKWAEDVISQCAEFPNGAHDDLLDTCTIAWTYLRRMFWLELGDEDNEDDALGVAEDNRKRRWYLKTAA